MGKNTIFTKEQQIIIGKIIDNDYICSNFYFTGGTALSNFYLQHRLSDDLDFFSLKKFSQNEIDKFIKQLVTDFSCTYSAEFRSPTYIYFIRFNKNTTVKIDFSYYPYQQLETGITYKKIYIDSQFDITVNKLMSINQRSEVKDFVDLYFLLKKKYSIWDVLNGIEIKFKIDPEPLLWAADLLNVERIDYLPRMLKPLTINELKLFFRKQAVILGKRTVTN